MPSGGGSWARYPSAEPTEEAEEESEQADGDAGLDEHRPVDVGTQFGEAGLELLGHDVVTVLGGLSDGVSDGVGLCRREVGGGQRARDGVRVEHRFRLPRTSGFLRGVWRRAPSSDGDGRGVAGDPWRAGRRWFAAPRL